MTDVARAAEPVVEVTSGAELRDLLGEPSPAAVAKERSRLHQLDRGWLAASPFCLLATAGADGRCDVSPKGDPPGFALVLDDMTIAIPERPGNRRVDGFRNILVNPHVGLVFFLPGRGDTLRINGRARLVRDAPFLDAMVVEGHRPVPATSLPTSSSTTGRPTPRASTGRRETTGDRHSGWSRQGGSSPLNIGKCSTFSVTSSARWCSAVAPMR